MSFSESMHRLLRLRKSLERQEEMKLTLANAQLQTARRGLAEEQQRSRSEQAALEERMREADGQPISAAELHFATMQREAERMREQHLESAVAQLASAHQTQTQALRERTRDRETLDTLRAQHEETLRREQGRREQAEADEAYLLRPPPK